MLSNFSADKPSIKLLELVHIFNNLPIKVITSTTPVAGTDFQNPFIWIAILLENTR